MPRRAAARQQRDAGARAHAVEHGGRVRGEQDPAALEAGGDEPVQDRCRGDQAAAGEIVAADGRLEVRVVRCDDDERLARELDRVGRRHRDLLRHADVDGGLVHERGGVLRVRRLAHGEPGVRPRAVEPGQRGREQVGGDVAREADAERGRAAAGRRDVRARGRQPGHDLLRPLREPVAGVREHRAAAAPARARRAGARTPARARRCAR